VGRMVGAFNRSIEAFVATYIEKGVLELRRNAYCFVRL